MFTKWLLCSISSVKNFDWNCGSWLHARGLLPVRRVCLHSRAIELRYLRFDCLVMGQVFCTGKEFLHLDLRECITMLDE